MRIVRYETLAISDNVKASFGFSYCIEIPSMLDFHEVRVWLTKTYGEGHKFFVGDDIINNNGRAKWGYKLVYKRYLIYLLGDEEFAWFKLKFGEHYVHGIKW
jgi:hypothetical protein